MSYCNIFFFIIIILRCLNGGCRLVISSMKLHCRIEGMLQRGCSSNGIENHCSPLRERRLGTSQLLLFQAQRGRRDAAVSTQQVGRLEPSVLTRCPAPSQA